MDDPRQVLENEAFTRMIKNLQRQVFDEWGVCQDAVKREELWHKYNVVTSLEGEMRTMLTDMQRR